MTNKEVVLAAMAPSEGDSYSPVQIQKMLFLIDKQAELDGGPHFDFRPYSYGPFDKMVYDVIEGLADSGLATIRHDGVTRIFALTPRGQNQGKSLLNKLPHSTKRFIRAVSKFVREHSFTQLVAAIYKAYPDMAVNSVFRGGAASS